MDLNEIPSLEEISKTLNSSIQDDPVLPIEEIVKGIKNTGDRYSTGISIFDEAMTGGFKDGDLVIISGISGEGKTSFAQTLTYNLTKKSIPCLWFSYEVVIDELHKKFLEMNISEHYFAYSPKINTSGSIDWIKYKIKEAWVKYATKVIFIDHIDFLTPSSVKDSDTREASLKKITTELKSLAIELRVVIVLLAHLKKLPEGKKEPDMQDIGYSAGVFQLADYVFMVMREKLNKRQMGGDSGEIATNNGIIKIVKNRQTGILKFNKMLYNNGKFNDITNLEECSPRFEEPKMLFGER